MTTNGHAFQIYAAPTREPEIIAVVIMSETKDGAQAGLNAMYGELDERGGAAMMDNPQRGAGGRWISTGKAMIFGEGETCCETLARLSVGPESVAS